MAKKNTPQPQADNLQELESALTRTEHFIENNQKIITYAVSGIILVVVAFLAFKKFYMQPKEGEAQSQMFMAQNYFEKDSFNLALNGDGNYLGFLDIINDYSITRTAKVAKYYAGISYLRIGKYEDALDYLNKFKTKDILLAPVIEGAKGDACLELGQQEKALSHYKKAIELNDNELTAPIFMMKAGSVYETLDDPQKALEIYNKLKEKYPNTSEGATVDKYIARLQTKLNK
jgi:tetratricopeptide (TPR) repeat protein